MERPVEVDNSIDCGDATCAEVCCPSVGTCETAKTWSDACVDDDWCGVVLLCDGPEDCAGSMFCCAADFSLDLDCQMLGTQCGTAQFGCSLPGTERVCHDDADCPDGGVCQLSARSEGFAPAPLWTCHD